MFLLFRIKGWDAEARSLSPQGIRTPPALGLSPPYSLQACNPFHLQHSPPPPTHILGLLLGLFTQSLEKSYFPAAPTASPGEPRRSQAPKPMGYPFGVCQDPATREPGGFPTTKAIPCVPAQIFFYASPPIFMPSSPQHGGGGAGTGSHAGAIWGQRGARGRDEAAAGTPKSMKRGEKPPDAGGDKPLGAGGWASHGPWGGCGSPQPPTRDRDGVRDRVWDHPPIPISIPIPMAQRKAVPAAARAPPQLPNRDVGDPKRGPGGVPGAAQPPPDPLPPPPSGTDLLRGAARRLRCFLLAAAEGPGAERLPLRGWSRGGAAGASPEL